jgi:hypothetical protein
LDLIPDFLLPYIGWIDDGVVLGTIYYLIRYGRFPFFLFKKKGGFKQAYQNKAENFDSNKKHQQDNGQTYQKDTSSKTIPTPYEILGVDPKASKKEIQTAYKKAIKKYHPDKVSHLGEEFTRLANKKFIEIQNAYDILMQNKN